MVVDSRLRLILCVGMPRNLRIECPGAMYHLMSRQTSACRSRASLAPVVPARNRDSFRKQPYSIFTLLKWRYQFTQPFRYRAGGPKQPTTLDNGSPSKRGCQVVVVEYQHMGQFANGLLEISQRSRIAALSAALTGPQGHRAFCFLCGCSEGKNSWPAVQL